MHVFHFVYTIAKRMKLSKNPGIIPGRKNRLSFKNDNPFIDNNQY